MNKVVGIGITGLAIYTLVKIAQVKNIADSISTKLVNPRIYKIALGGVILRTEVSINNPTADSLTLTKPVIILTTNGQSLTQSKPSDKELTIKPLAITMMDTIELELGWTVFGKYVAGILKKVPDLIFAFETGDLSNIGKVLGIPLEMAFSTYSNGIFYQSPPTKIM